MKKTKLIVMIMATMMALALTTSFAYAADTASSAGQTLYAPDGRTIVVDPSETEAYESVGWYTFPVITMYAPDGRKIVVSEVDIESCKNVGWYTEPVVLMYAPDGRTAVAHQSEAESYRSVGWYYEPVQTMYALDGREIVVFKTQVGAYQNVGWYLPEDYIIILADYLCDGSRYNEAVIALKRFTEPTGEWYVEDYVVRARLKNKLNEVFYKWLTEVGSPIGVIDWYLSKDDNGKPRVNVELRNLTDKAIAGFEIEWTCYDYNGMPATDYPDLHNGIVSAWADGKEFLPGETEVCTWTLKDNSQTASISWPYPKKATFDGGYTWQR